MEDGWDVERFHEGDPELFRELVDRLSPRLLSAARSFADSLDHAHDLVQATWTTVWEKRGQFLGEGDLSGWIMTILYRTCLQDRRGRDTQRRLTESMMENLTPSRPSDPAAALDLAQRMAALHEGLARLSAKELEIALLTFRDGMTSIEISKRLGISASTVRVHVANIRRKLREHRRDTL